MMTMPDGAACKIHRPPWRFGAAAVLVALVVYGLTAAAFQHSKSPQGAYFNYLADAFLHGRLDLARPPGEHDLTPFQGKWYVPFPPLPALLMLPWVAMAGLANTNTVWFSIVVGAANVWLVWWLLAGLARRGLITLCVGDRFWLTLMFALGTIHWQIAVDGQVWFLGHICTLMFMLLSAALAVSTGSPWLSGLALACAMLGRPNVIFVFPLLHALALSVRQLRDDSLPEATTAPPGSNGGWNESPSERDTWKLLGAGLRGWDIGWLLRCLVPIAVAAGLLMSYNFARFGDALDFGYTRQKVDSSVLDNLFTYGQFSLHHVPRNLEVMLLGHPKFERGNFLPTPDDHGMSIFLTTPALLLVLNAQGRDRLTRSAWLATGLLLIPLLLYYNTGWVQFGYRFSLDFLTPLIVLMALAARPRLSTLMKALIVVGIAVNAWGVNWWFGTVVH